MDEVGDRVVETNEFIIGTMKQNGKDLLSWVVDISSFETRSS